MKVLFLALEVSYPPSNGITLRLWSILRGLHATGHSVTVLGFGESETLATLPVEFRSHCELVQLNVASMSGSYSLAGRLRAMLKGQPFAANRFVSAPMQAAVAQYLSQGRYDAVVADAVYSAVNLPAELEVPLILNTQNIEHLLVQRYACQERRPAHRLYAEWEWRRLRQWERQWWSRANVVVACSEVDQRTIVRSVPKVPCTVVPNVVDVTEYVNYPLPSPLPGAEPTILYTGGMDWLPNRDAVEYFVTRIWPQLLRLHPHARFVVAGRPGPQAFDSWLRTQSRVECTGRVPDMRAVLASADICVVPLRIGSGTRLKIIEAAAMSKPIVSTVIGAEGLDFVHERDILIADSPDEMVQSVGRLLHSPALRRQLGQSAREVVEHRYSQACVEGSLAATLAVAGRRSSTNTAALIAEGGHS